MSDLSALREGMRDPRTGKSVSLGIVILDEDRVSHYEVRPTSTDIFVRVELQPEQRPVWCRLAGPWAGASVGMYVVPRLGAEVVVLTPGGDTAADPILVAGLSTGGVPASVGIDVVIMAGAGIVRLGADSGTVAVALAPATEARLAALEAHRHYLSSTPGVTGAPMLMSAEYTSQVGAGTTASPNPLHGVAGHVHYDTAPNPEPTVNSAAMGSGSAVAATKVQGV